MRVCVCAQNCGLNHTKRGCQKSLENLFSIAPGDLRAFSLKEILRADEQFPIADYNAFLDADPALILDASKPHLDTAGRLFFSLLITERAVIQMNRLNSASVLLWAKLIKSGEQDYKANSVPDEVLALAMQQAEFTKKGDHIGCNCVLFQVNFHQLSLSSFSSCSSFTLSIFYVVKPDEDALLDAEKKKISNQTPRKKQKV